VDIIGAAGLRGKLHDRYASRCLLCAQIFSDPELYGALQEFYSRPWEDRNHIYPLTLPSGKTINIVVRERFNQQDITFNDLREYLNYSLVNCQFVPDAEMDPKKKHLPISILPAKDHYALLQLAYGYGWNNQV
jgi:hypothetical protein